MANSITQNTTFMTVASVGQKVISFFYFTLIARSIGPEETGKYFFALSFTTLFVVFVDLGFTNVLVREAAKAREKVQEYLSTIVAAKIFFAVFSYAAAIMAIHVLGYPVEIRLLVYLSAVTMIFDSFHLTLYGVLRSLGNITYEAISIVASQFLTLVMGTIFLLLDFPLIFLILAFTIPSFLNFCYALIVVRKKYAIRFVPHVNRQMFRYLGRIAIPFALAAIFARIYSTIDSILLSKLVDTTAVGLYSIPYKVTFAFQFVPLALVAALYPRFSEYFVTNKERLAYIFQRSLLYVWIIAFPIAAGISVLAQDIILTLYTDQFLAAVLPLQILIMSLVFSFASFPIGSFLNACNRQGTQTTIVATVMIINIVLNLLLIPKWGIVGAATAAFIGNFLLAAGGYFFVPKITHVPHMVILKSFLQIAVAATVMGATVWFANMYAHFSFAILVGVVVYPVFLLGTGALRFEQITEVMQLLRFGSRKR